MSGVNSSTQKVNPFFGVTVGSTISDNQGLTFGGTVFDKGLTTFKTGLQIDTDMSGNSAYVYSDSMNRGSFGVSGAYGSSLGSQVSGGLSAYFGNSYADAGKTIQVDYNIRVITGVESLAFHNLTPLDLQAGLKEGPGRAADNVLEKFIALKDAVGNKDLLKAIDEPLIGKLAREWSTAVQKFYRNYGDGVVVGVIWGGLGQVSMTLEDKSKEETFKYGGTANFAYSSMSAAVSVEASFGRSGKSSTNNINFKVSTSVHGRCAKEAVDKWEKELGGKAFADVSGIKMLDKAPSVDCVAAIPKLPDFTKSKDLVENAEARKKLAEIEKLSDFAKVSVMQKVNPVSELRDVVSKNDTNDINENKDNTKPESEKINQELNQPADAKPVSELRNAVSKNEISVVKYEEEKTKKHYRHSFLEETPEKEEKSKKKAADTTEFGSDFVPLGVWIVNWAELFPWLATGYANNLSGNSLAKELLVKQCALSDFITLNRIYGMLAATAIPNNFSPAYKGNDPVIFKQIASAFSSATQILREFWESDDAIRLSLDALGDAGKAIYTAWDKMPILRNAELGLGLLYKKNKSILPKPAELKLHGTYVEQSLEMDACTFSGKNFSAFKDFIKLAPFFMPDGKLYMFGPAGMMLAGVDNGNMLFTLAPGRATTFRLNEAKNALISETEPDIELIPIPLAAAKGQNDWLGQSIGASLSSNVGLKAHLDRLEKEMKNQKMYSLSSDSWDKSGRKITDHYIPSLLKTQYVGILDIAKHPSINII